MDSPLPAPSRSRCGSRAASFAWARSAPCMRFAVAVNFTNARALGPLLAAGGLLCAAQALGPVPLLAVALLALALVLLADLITVLKPETGYDGRAPDGARPGWRTT